MGWLLEHTALLGWLAVLSIGSLALTVALLPVIVARLPADYFLAAPSRHRAERTWSDWLVRIGKNVLGVVFVLAGIAMLVLPGQGLLTILIGLLLVDFPGKRALELRLVRRPAIRSFLDRMRTKRGRPPLQLDGP
jgi:hypothetical protein